jgi:Cdc6-like AAA superfamily ATPase
MVLDDLGLFKKGVVDYISKKIAAISSDIRRTLKLCK